MPARSPQAIRAYGDQALASFHIVLSVFGMGFQASIRVGLAKEAPMDSMGALVGNRDATAGAALKAEPMVGIGDVIGIALERFRRLPQSVAQSVALGRE